MRMIVLALLLFSMTSGCTYEPNLVNYTYDAYQIDSNGDTVKRLTEKGKQGRWRYHVNDSTTVDTVFRDGVVQTINIVRVDTATP